MCVIAVFASSVQMRFVSGVAMRCKSPAHLVYDQIIQSRTDACQGHAGIGHAGDRYGVVLPRVLLPRRRERAVFRPGSCFVRGSTPLAPSANV
jgi:hypothetical protein